MPDAISLIATWTMSPVSRRRRRYRSVGLPSRVCFRRLQPAVLALLSWAAALSPFGGSGAHPVLNSLSSPHSHALNSLNPLAASSFGIIPSHCDGPAPGSGAAFEFVVHEIPLDLVGNVGVEGSFRVRLRQRIAGAGDFHDNADADAHDDHDDADGC